MHRKPLVVILGGGFGGVRVALDLARKRAAKIILIDPNDYHSVHSQYYELATAFRAERKGETQREERRAFHDMLRTATVPFEHIFAGLDVQTIKSRAERVDPKKSAVILEGGRVIHYEWLVIAIGSQTNYFGIPHLEQNSLGLKSITEAMNVRDHVDELFLSSPKHKKINIVVGGGGFTGVELACELVGYMKKLSHTHNHPMGNWNCIIVEAGPAVLGSTSAWVQKKVQKRIRKLGITLLLNSPIVDVWPNLMYIGKEKRAFPFDLLVWTAGVKGSCPIDIVEGTMLDKRNCIFPDLTLRVPMQESIFVLGDAATTLDPKTANPVPMTAQKAIHEARYVSRALRRLIKDKKTHIVSYVPKSSSFIIPLGGKYAVVQTPYFHVAGFLSWALKYVVLLRYLRSILPIRRAIAFVGRELALYTKND